MRRPFSPAVEAPFMIAHEILAGQDWMLFDPDDRLREVQLAASSAPAGNWRSWRSRPRYRNRGPVQARVPCCRTRQRAVDQTLHPIRNHSPAVGPWRAASSCVGFDFSGMPSQHRSSWWCVAPWNELRPAAMALLLRGSTLHVVGRIGVDQLNRRAAEQPVHVLGLARIAAQQAMVAKNPQIARLGSRLVRRLGHVVGVGQPLERNRTQNPGQLIVMEAQQVEIEIELFECINLLGQKRRVPSRRSCRFDCRRCGRL